MLKLGIPVSGKYLYILSMTYTTLVSKFYLLCINHAKHISCFYKK